jgi:signal transduction histidine kinase
MPSSEETLKALVRILIHDVRNKINGMVLELTDLRERWAEDRIARETKLLTQQAMGIANHLRDLQEHLEPSAPHLQESPLAEAWKAIAPQSPELADAADKTLSLEIEQIANAVKGLVTNAVEAGTRDAVPVGQVEHGYLFITVENALPEPPANLEQWGSLPGYTLKRRHMGLGCSYARSVALAHGGECTWTYDAQTKRLRAQLTLPVSSTQP